MKRILLAVVLSLALAVNAFAASSIVPTVHRYASPSGNVVVLKLVCTAHTDGAFTDTYPNGKTVTAAEFGYNYFANGYYLLDAWAVNSATDDHTNAAVVTISDATGRVIIGAASGDTLSLSQAASGIAYASMSRSAGQRHISDLITIAIADTGSTATVQTLYIVFGR